MPTQDWRKDGERLARLEEQVVSINEKLTSLPPMAASINAMQLTMARDAERSSILRYAAHAATVALGGIMGLISGHHGLHD